MLLLGLTLAACGDSGPGVSVDDFSPIGEVERATNFTITFSKDVVSDSLLSVPLGEAPVAFTPAIPGQFQWIAPNRLRFYPDVMLAPSTEYRAEVLSKAVSPHGLSLQGDREFVFATSRLHVTSAYLSFEYDRGSNKQAKLVGTIEFNQEVAPEEVLEKVSVVYTDGGRIPYQLVTKETGTVMALEAAGVRRDAEERKIELRVEQGLRGVGGTLGLADTYVQPVLLPGQNSLKVEGLAAVRESGTSQFLKLRFNLPVRGEGVSQYLVIKPAVEVRAVSSHDHLKLYGAFSPDQTYQVTVRQGLVAFDGSRLGRDFSSAVTFHLEDIPPQLDFVGDGFYLTRSGNLNLGLSSINTDKVTVEVDRIYPNNLVQVLNAYNMAEPEGYYYWGAELAAIGKQVHTEDLVIPLQRNEETVTPIAIEPYLRESGMGIFKVTAMQTEERWNSVSRWVVATDLGLIGKMAGDDLWVWATSLTSLEPVRGAEVRLYSQNNQTLASARTNDEGIAVIPNMGRFREGFTPYVLTASLGGDLSFLELTRRQLSTSDFDVAGQPYLTGGYEAFVYNERGVYRPGERAHLAAIVRGPNASVPTPFPVKLRVTGPDGRVLEEQRTRLNDQGGTAFTLDVPDDVLTGRYAAALVIGENEEIGWTNFSVEEFVPDRMKVSLQTDRTAYRPGQPLRFDVEGLTLFGPPAAGRRVQAKVAIEPYAFAPKDYASYTFGNAQKTFTEVRADLDEQTLDAQGRGAFTYLIPPGLKPPSSLRAVVEATVLEPGGRGVTAYRSAVVHPYETYVGVRLRRDGYAEPGKPYTVDCVVLDTEGRPLAGRPVHVALYHTTWNTIWRRDDMDGRYRYVSEEVESLESTASSTSLASAGRLTVTPKDYGSYRLVVEDGRSGSTTSVSFYSSGWGFSAWALDAPERVNMKLDKAVYRPGEKAKVLVQAPFPGKLLLTIEREKVYDHRVVTLTENTATIELPVTDAYKPNVYVSAHLVRSTDDLDRDESARAFGVVPLTVDAGANRLAVEVTTPAEMRPNNKLTVDVRVRGGEGRPLVTIAAVDEGITQLTDFQTPDPHAFFFGKRQLSVESYDLYGVILPEVAASVSSPAGDVEASRKRYVSPVAARRVKPVAYWSGVVETDRQGRGRVSFDVPSFAGTVRVMAVAYAGDTFGSAEKSVLVRDPLVMTPTFPRFVGSGDEFVVPVSLFNGSGRDAAFEVRLQATGPVKLRGEPRQSVRVANGREGQVYFNVVADRTLGKATFRVVAQGGGQTTSEEVEVPVRPPVPYVTEAGSGSIKAGATARFTFPAGFLPGTADYELVLSSFPVVRFAGSLQYLLQYPHGCVEQTTSRLFPLLAFNDLARIVEPELFAVNSAGYFLEEGIAKLERMQMPSGAFAYWPDASYANTWSTVYTAHFLVEARKAGHVVSDRVYRKMLEAVGAVARDYRGEAASSLEESAYAVYVLALAGRPDKSTQLYLKNNTLDRLPVYARYLLAGAFAHAGDRATAKTLLPQIALPPVSIQRRETGDNFDSDIRARAIMLDLLAEIDPASPQVPQLVNALTQSAAEGQWYTTQENAFAFLALGKILRRQADARYTGTVTVGGKALATFDTNHQRLTSKEWAGKTVTVALQGTGTAYYYWRVDGLPAALDVDEFDRDLVVRRRYLTESGSPVTDLSSFRQGDMIIAELTITAREDLENVAVVDLLPAGLEIENPRLQSRAGIDWIADEAYVPDNLDIRDDRLLLYGDFLGGKQEKFYYGLRAVTAGTFKLPPVRAEAMYAPMKASVAGSGRIVVRGAGSTPLAVR